MPDHLLMDRQTFSDLEIFATESGAPGLFDRLDRTRTLGGRESLRRRFLRPWSDPDGIRAVQASLRFVLEHPGAFTGLPDDNLLGPLLRYLDSRYTTLASHRGPRAWLEVAWIRLRYGDMYREVVAGVRLTTTTLEALAAFASAIRALDPPGELGDRARELDDILRDNDVARLLARGTRTASGGAALRLDAWIRDRCRGQIRGAVVVLNGVDALRSMAEACAEEELCFAEIGADGTIQAEGLRHPFLAEPVVNDLAVGGDCSVVFLTGPNMAGKTTYLRACGIAVYLAHLGMGVPAERFRFTPVACLFSGLTTADSLTEGVSYFLAEARRVKEVARLLTEGVRAFALFDEMFKGTNVKDALDACLRVIPVFARADGSVFLVSSHLVELAQELAGEPRITLRYFDARLRAGVPHFDYALKEGASAQRLGLTVLEGEGVFDLLDRIPARA
jgi:DNA mismatch repair protein MutS